MISVVIPSYNRKDTILKLLADLREQENAEFEVIVVDDCSPDGSADAIREQFPEVRLFENEENGGPCVSRNRGVMAARGEIIVGFDSDVSVPDHQLLAKVERAYHDRPEATGFAFRLYKPDGCTDDRPRWWHPRPFASSKDRSFETDYFSGTGYAFRREPMIEAGLYPEFLYMHYEEVLLAYRILDAGGSIFYEPSLTVLHHANPTPRRNKIKCFYKPRNQILVALHCYPFLKGLRYTIPRIAYSFVQTAFCGDPLGTWRALWSAAKASPTVIASRSVLAPDTWERMQALPK